MLSPQRALLCNLNHIHLQHVSLGLHLSRRPELREGAPLSTSPPPGDTGGKESRGPCGGALVDANSNSPAVPCRCCRDHGPALENRPQQEEEEDEGEEEEDEGPASPSDPGCSSSLSSCSDLSPDESPVSVYSRDHLLRAQPAQPGERSGSRPAPAEGPGACSPDSFCCSPDSCSGASTPPGPGLDSNCNALPTCRQDVSSPGVEEEEDGSEPPEEAEDGRGDPGRAEPSWNINPIWRSDAQKSIEADWRTQENNNSAWTGRRGVTSSTGPTEAGQGGRADAASDPKSGCKSDVRSEPGPQRTITSFHELAQKRKRGSGLPVVPQAKKDRSDWLIVFSPDSELPPVASAGSLGGPREVTTFKELRTRSRAPQPPPPPPLPPREPPAGWALVPPRPPPPPVPPRRKKNRAGLQPIAEAEAPPPDHGRPGSPAPAKEASDAAGAREPCEPGAQARLQAAAGPLLLPRPLVLRFSEGGPVGVGVGAAGSLLLAPLAGLRLLAAPSPPEEQLLPVRLSPVGAYSPPARGALPCLASPELAALLLSPLFPRSSTFPAAAPPPRQVAVPPLPPPPRPPKASPRWTRSPPPPPRLRKTGPGWTLGPAPGRSAPCARSLPSC